MKFSRKINQPAFGCFGQKQRQRKANAVWFLNCYHAFLVAFVLLFSPLLMAQEVILINGEPCGIHGNAKNPEIIALNVYKNRYTAPNRADFNTAVNLDALLNSGDPNQFSQQKAAVVRGYVYDVKIGGIETCNCKAKDALYRDTHIEITPDENHTDAKDRLIVEVTPRLREMMAKRGVDWTTSALRKNIKGKWVEVAGWLTYDVEHETAAYANDPDDAIGQHNWRATAWEVHPITYLNVIKKGTANSLNAILAKQGGAEGPAIEKRAGSLTEKPAVAQSGHGSVWLVLVGLIVLVLAFFLLKNKLL